MPGEGREKRWSWEEGFQILLSNGRLLLQKSLRAGGSTLWFRGKGCLAQHSHVLLCGRQGLVDPVHAAGRVAGIPGDQDQMAHGEQQGGGPTKGRGRVVKVRVKARPTIPSHASHPLLAFRWVDFIRMHLYIHLASLFADVCCQALFSLLFMGLPTLVCSSGRICTEIDFKKQKANRCSVT